MNSYDIVAKSVRLFWKMNHPQDVIAFFSQKYEFDEDWEFCAELASPAGSSDFETVIFENDFCEGQTEVEDIKIIPLCKIIQFFLDNGGVEWWNIFFCEQANII